ncbi:MAG TPA: stage II sporulation protein M [Symbiobacteriaceae bacterium]
MYRKLMLLSLLLFGLLAGVAAYYAPLPPIPGSGWSTGAGARSGPGLVLVFFLTDGVPYGLMCLLAWATAFHPSRRYRWWQAALKYAAGAAGAALGAAVLYGKGALAGNGARALALQTGKPVGLMLLAGQGPHAVLEIVALSAALALPIYWLFRGAGTGSFRRATFEGWAEIRRRAWVWIVVLALAAVVQTYLTPQVLAWALQSH